MKQRASMVYPDHDAGGFAAIDAVLSHRRKPEAIRAHASQWGKHLDVEDFLRARARGSGGSWRRNGPLKTETRVRIPLGPPQTKEPDDCPPAARTWGLNGGFRRPIAIM